MATAGPIILPPDVFQMNYPKKQVTIRQVASAAGVSAQTVSRVINDRPDVAPTTRQRVQQVIRQLGYQPNAIARSLIHQRTRTLGVVATRLDYYGPSRTLMGIEQETRALGYSLLLDLLHHPEAADLEPLLNRLLSHQVDGIIWAVPEIGGNRTWLERRVPHLPIPVIYLSMQARPELAVVAIDNRSGGRMATEHLLSQGYQNIGILTGPLEWWEARERLLGWQDALKSAARPIEFNQIVEGDWSAASGASGIRRLLEAFPQMDAAFVCNDQMAVGVLQTAPESGRRIPEDLAIVGFDDTPEAAYYRPPLTTVQQQLVDLGCTAVRELCRMIDANYQLTPEVEPPAILLQPKLIIRQSSFVSKPILHRSYLP
jgi:LacI family transcriptional regulator